MGREIQVPHHCVMYQPNENLNLTCNGKTRCVIYYDELCMKYKTEKEENNASTISKTL